VVRIISHLCQNTLLSIYEYPNDEKAFSVSNLIQTSLCFLNEVVSPNCMENSQAGEFVVNEMEKNNLFMSY
jgi:hypothetical protein